MAQTDIDDDHCGNEIGECQAKGKGGAESWLIQVKKRFHSRQYKVLQPPSNVSIYRVPKSMMSSKPEAYVPLLVSFGPYHHKKEHQLSVMDDHKLEGVERTLKRLDGIDIYNLTAQVKNMEGRIRVCYQDSAAEYNGETLAWMLTMDACFILEFFRALSKGMSKEEQCFSLIFQNGDGNVISWEIKRDILKLENQIPLFVLIHILELELKTHEKAVSMLAKILSCFQEFKGFPFSLEAWEGQITLKLEEHIKKGAWHLLDLCRRLIADFLTNSYPQPASVALLLCTDQNKFERISTPTAEELQKAGIFLKPSFEGKVRFENRRFAASYFCLPKIIVGDDTETILRNLLAFEECQRCRIPAEATVISQYVGLVDDLIESHRDVALLRDEGIIISLMGRDEEIGDLFHDLDREITIESIEQYEIVVKQVNDHYHSVLNLWIRQFKEEYFSRPWYVVSLVVAILVLGMTALQTYYATKNK